MRLRAHRRNLVVWSPSVGPADGYGAPSLTQLARTRRIHRFIRTGALLTVIGLMRLARAVRRRWRPLLAGGVLTVVGVILRSGAWGAVLFLGLLFLLSTPLIPARSDADRKRRSELERELAWTRPSLPFWTASSSRAARLFDSRQLSIRCAWTRCQDGSMTPASQPGAAADSAARIVSRANSGRFRSRIRGWPAECTCPPLQPQA